MAIMTTINENRDNCEIRELKFWASKYLDLLTCYVSIQTCLLFFRWIMKQSVSILTKSEPHLNCRLTWTTSPQQPGTLCRGDFKDGCMFSLRTIMIIIIRKSSSNFIRLWLFCKVNRDYGGTEDFFVDIAVELVLERRSLLDRKVLFFLKCVSDAIMTSLHITSYYNTHIPPKKRLLFFLSSVQPHCSSPLFGLQPPPMQG